MPIRQFLPDNFTLALLATVVLASFYACGDRAAHFLNIATYVAIALLFFLHGAKLERSAVIAGMKHWPLHTLVFTSTFIIFPLLGLLLRPVLTHLITPELYVGVLFLCTLPSTVQSSIAFTSIARGNVPAAVCSASASSILGILVTPLLCGFIINTNQGMDAASTINSILSIAQQLLLPFIVGQTMRPIIGRWVDRNRGLLKFFDQGSILLIVYAAFSAAVAEGLWHRVSPRILLGLIAVNIILLVCALVITCIAARSLGFNKEDEITIVFCGSKKSLASGAPIANILFPAHIAGMLVLPLMIFHQIQLITCAVLARIYAKRHEQPNV